MRRLILLPILLVLMAPSCPDALKDIARGLNTAAISVGEVQTLVISASDTGVITKESSDAFLEGATIPILTAIGHANTAVALLVAMEEQDRDEILEILPPVIEAIEGALADEKLGIISNEGTKASVLLTLQSIQAALNIVQASVEVSK